MCNEGVSVPTSCSLPRGRVAPLEGQLVQTAGDGSHQRCHMSPDSALGGGDGPLMVRTLQVVGRSCVCMRKEGGAEAVARCALQAAWRGVSGDRPTHHALQCLDQRTDVHALYNNVPGGNIHTQRTTREVYRYMSARRPTAGCLNQHCQYMHNTTETHARTLTLPGRQSQGTGSCWPAPRRSPRRPGPDPLVGPAGLGTRPPLL